MLLSILQIQDESIVVDSGDNLDCTEQSKTVLVKIVNKSSVFQSMSEIEKKSIYITVKTLISLLTSYCTHQLPVLGYNSSRYDICLVRKQLFTQNELDDDKKHFVIKINSSYMTISTPTLKFLDAPNYLAAGTSYDSFLKSYDTEVRKSYFPYEWLDDYSKLQYSQLPSYDAFYSKLKGVNTLEAEYIHVELISLFMTDRSQIAPLLYYVITISELHVQFESSTRFIEIRSILTILFNNDSQ